MLYASFASAWGRTLYSSDDGGETWDFLEFLPVVSLDLVAMNGALYEARMDGLWYRPLPVVSGEDDGWPHPHGFTLFPGYPNPFNPSTQISYDLPTGGFVQLIVFDVFGRKVVMLEDGFRPPGRHMVTWNATGFAIGSYVLRMLHNGHSRTQKLVLAK